MSWFYRKCLRPVLFTQNPETIHGLTLKGLGLIGRHEVLSDAFAAFCGGPELPMTVWGLKFPNPIGLAAGMDKEAHALPAWAAMGFGFTELGGVTCHAQPGNPVPRVFRAIKADAIVNRMGFNNPGAEAMSQTLAHWRNSGRWPHHPVGMNLGKSKITPLDKAAEDYANSLRVLWPYLDFFVVNVSSPNTPNLRQLQDKKALDEILAALQEINESFAKRAVSEEANSSTKAHTHSDLSDVKHNLKDYPSPKPLLVKVAPDLSFNALDEILELTETRNLSGIVATNTTIARPETSDARLQKVYAETGGLSGRPLRERSTEVIRHLYRQTRGHLPIMGVGGIFNADDAWEKITSGASLLQVYTGLVYEGPTMVQDIVAGLKEKLEQTGLEHLSQAVGIENRAT